MNDEMITITCECGKHVERPARYQDLTDIVIARWKLQYCNDCLSKRMNKAFNVLPEIMCAIAESDNQNDCSEN